MENTNNTNNDSLYWSLLGLTTGVIFLSLVILGVAILVTPTQNQELYSGRLNNKYSGFSQSLPQESEQTITQSSQTQAETWIFKGYALGKNAGNEIGSDVMMSEVVRLPDDKYRMYYGWAGPGKTGIKSAISNDGKIWTVESGFRLEGAGDKTNRENVISGPSIVKLSSGKWRMYYQSSAQFSSSEPPKFHVRSAISSDGLNFSREGVRIDITPYTQETGLKLAGHGTYFMAQDGIYVGIFSANMVSASGPSDLVMATSEDGLTFSNFKKLYTSWHDPIVLKTKEGYRIYATYLLEKQGTAVSLDGLNWPKDMTTITFQDEKGSKLTEGNSGLGDLGGIVTPDEKIIIYANWGNPSQNIVSFEKQ